MSTHECSQCGSGYTPMGKTDRGVCPDCWTEMHTDDEEQDENHNDMAESGTMMSDTELNKLPVEQKIKHMIDHGLHDPYQWTNHAKRSAATLRDYASSMAEGGKLDRVQDGQKYVYYLPDGESSTQPTAASQSQPEPDSAGQPATASNSQQQQTGEMPVNRDYDWSQYEIDPEDITEFVSADGELEEMLHLIGNRELTGHKSHFLLSGPTGTGKTMLARNVAAKIQAVEEAVDGPVPVFPIQCSDGMMMKDVIGGPTVVDDETWWVDGNGTKALLASQSPEEGGYDGPVVLLLDEVNRVKSQIKSALMALLDDRAELVLDERGGEIIQGDPENLIVISTMNPADGSGYSVNPIDLAERRRLGEQFELEHLGVHDPAAEAKLVTEQTPVCGELAAKLVETANELRAKANDDSEINFGVTTGLVLDWATGAFGRAEISDQPVYDAALSVIVRPFFSDDPKAERLAESIVERNVGDLGVEPSEVREAVSTVGDTGDEKYLACTADECSWFEDKEAVDDIVRAIGECPECGAQMREQAEDAV